MKTLVCIKQVPGTSDVKVDPVTGVLIRDGVASKMNPYDLFALETGLKLKETLGGSVDTLSMGPPQTKDILYESFYMGADNGTLLSDRKFAGADVLATSYAISQGVKRLGHFDLILCGKQTTDGDTAQVGPEMAEFLGIPHVTNVTKILEARADGLLLEMNMGDTVEIQFVPFPCLVAVDKDIYTPRLPSYKRRKALEGKKDITVLSLKDMYDTDEAHYGLNGSATQVERIFPPENTVEQEIFTGTPSVLAGKLYDTLKEQKFI